MNPGKQKTTADQGEAAEPVTIGTVVGEKARAQANTFTDERREDLLAGALARIFGENGRVKANSSCH
jgi:hypothetical protein